MNRTAEWNPIDLRQWPDCTQGQWLYSQAAYEQQYGEQRIEHAQDADDEAMSNETYPTQLRYGS